MQEYLAERFLLLVLDGFEAVLAEADQISVLLSRAPGLKVLVTSRSLLSLQGEQIFPLNGLDYPGETDEELEIEQYSSVQLFVHSARRAHPHFQLTDQNRLAVGEICRLVRGMPLGILLAVA